MDLSVLPDWSRRLCNYYVVLRVDGRNKTLRRRYYRLVEREKFRLAVLGYCQRLIIALCRFLSDLNRRSYDRVVELLNNPDPQCSFNFT